MSDLSLNTQENITETNVELAGNVNSDIKTDLSAEQYEAIFNAENGTILYDIWSTLIAGSTENSIGIVL